MFKRALIIGWIIFLAYIALAFVFPRHVLAYGWVFLFLGILLGPLTFAYAVAYVVGNRLRNRKS